MLRYLACCCTIVSLAGAIVPSCLAPARTDVRIPPRLIQLWETNAAPAELEPMAAQWRSVAGWTARIWSDAQNERFIAENYAWLLPTFQQYQKQVQRADIARLARLHLEGGVYSDLDTQPCSTRSQDLDKVLGPQLLTLVHQPNGNLSNFFIGSVARHPFLDFVLRRAPAAWQHALAHGQANKSLTMQAHASKFLPPLSSLSCGIAAAAAVLAAFMAAPRANALPHAQQRVAERRGGRPLQHAVVSSAAGYLVCLYQGHSPRVRECVARLPSSA